MEPLEPMPETRAALNELVDFNEPDVGWFLQDLGEKTRNMVPEIVGMSLGLIRHGLTFTLLASESRLAVLDAAQYLDGGPCVEAVTTGTEIHAVMDDPLDEERWRLFSRASAVEGVASSLSLPVYSQGEVVGGVNLYASTEEAFEGHVEQLAAALGARAAEAVSNADLSFSTRLEAAAAPDRLRERAQIDTAVGLIAAQRGISVDEAQRHLVRAAARAGVPEAIVAQVIVTVLAQPGPDAG